MIDNHYQSTLGKARGQILIEIGEAIREHRPKKPCVFVRERGFSKYNNEVQALFEVVGVADYVVWEDCRCSFEELAPRSIKKLLTGNANAGKQAVADALEGYIGPQEYATDDESDAVAVGLAWLLKYRFIDPQLDSTRQ